MAILALGIWLTLPLRVPTLDQHVDVDDPGIRRRAVALPVRVAGVSALGWGVAGLVWGVLWPGT